MMNDRSKLGFVLLAVVILSLGCFVVSERSEGANYVNGTTWDIGVNPGEVTATYEDGVLTITSTVLAPTVKDGGDEWWIDQGTSYKSAFTEVVFGSSDDLRLNIGNNMFNNCPNLVTLTNSYKIIKVGDCGFKDCLKLKYGDLSHAQTIGKEAFKNCAAMGNWGLDGVKSIDDEAFYGAGIAIVPISADVTRIGDYAFAYSNAALLYLWSTAQSCNLQEIGDYAFLGCPLKEVYIGPGAPTTIGDNIFSVGAVGIKFHESGLTKDVAIDPKTQWATLASHAFYGAGSSVNNDLYMTDLVEAEGAPLHWYLGETLGSDVLVIINKSTADSTISIVVDPELSSARMTGFSSQTSGTVKGYVKYLYIDPNLSNIPDNMFCDVSYSRFYNLIGNSDSGLDLSGCRLKEIGVRAFDGCKILSLTTGDYLQTIDVEAFAGCTSLKSVVMGKSIQTLGESVFASCEYLESVDMSNTALTKLPSHTFSNCIHSLTTIKFPTVLTEIGYKCFTECHALTKLTLPDTVRKVNVEAFSNCTSLNTIYLSKLDSIGGGAFNGCKALTTLVVALQTKPTVGSYIFDQSIILWDENGNVIDYSSTESWVKIGGGTFLHTGELPDGVLKRQGVTREWNIGATNEDQVVAYLDGGVMTILCLGGTNNVKDFGTGWNWDGYYDEITSVSFIGIANAGANMFTGCSNLASVSLGTVTVVGASAFKNCTSLTSLNDLSKLKSIGDSAFNGCAGLAGTYIIADNSTIGSLAFSGCDLSYISFPTVFTASDDSFSGMTLSVLGQPIQHISEAAGLTFQKVSEKTLNALQGAFVLCRHDGVTETVMLVAGQYECNAGIGQIVNWTGLPSTIAVSGDLVIPKEWIIDGLYYEVTGIYDNAFMGITGLTSVTIPSTIVFIGPYAFYGCSSLSSIVFSDLESAGDLAIATDAFRGCVCTDLVLPARLSSITPGCFMFYDSNNNGTLRTITSYSSAFHVIDNCLLNSDNNVILLYANGSSLTSLSVPYGVVTIGQYAFAYATNLVTLELPGTVVQLMSQSVYRCTALKNLTLPDSITRIDDVFQGCPSIDALKIVSSVAPSPVILGTLNFNNWKLGGITFNSINIATSSNYGQPLDISRLIADGALTEGKILIIGADSHMTWSDTSPIYFYESGEKVNPDEGKGMAFLSNGTQFNGVQGAYIIAGGETYFLTIDQYSLDSENKAATVGGSAQIVVSGAVTIPNKWFFIVETETETEIYEYKVTSIDGVGFSSSAITSITMPKTLVTINDLAFNNCSSLTSLVIPDSLEIANGAFLGCNAVNSVTIILGDGASYSATLFGLNNLGKWTLSGINAEIVQYPIKTIVISEGARANLGHITDVGSYSLTINLHKLVIDKNAGTLVNYDTSGKLCVDEAVVTVENVKGHTYVFMEASVHTEMGKILNVYVSLDPTATYECRIVVSHSECFTYSGDWVLDPNGYYKKSFKPGMSLQSVTSDFLKGVTFVDGEYRFTYTWTSTTTETETSYSMVWTQGKIYRASAVASHNGTVTATTVNFTSSASDCLGMSVDGASASSVMYVDYYGMHTIVFADGSYEYSGNGNVFYATKDGITYTITVVPSDYGTYSPTVTPERIAIAFSGVRTMNISITG